MRERKRCQRMLAIKRGQREKEGVAGDVDTERDSVCVYACMRGCVLAFVKLVCLCLLRCFSSVGILYTTAGKHTAAWVCDLRHWAGARVKDCSHRITHPQAPFPKTF